MRVGNGLVLAHQTPDLARQGAEAFLIFGRKRRNLLKLGARPHRHAAARAHQERAHNQHSGQRVCRASRTCTHPFGLRVGCGIGVAVDFGHG